MITWCGLCGSPLLVAITRKLSRNAVPFFRVFDQEHSACQECGQAFCMSCAGAGWFRKPKCHCGGQLLQCGTSQDRTSEEIYAETVLSDFTSFDEATDEQIAAALMYEIISRCKLGCPGPRARLREEIALKYFLPGRIVAKDVWVADSATYETVDVSGPALIGHGNELSGCSIGPNVMIVFSEIGDDSILANTLCTATTVGKRAHIKNSILGPVYNFGSYFAGYWVLGENHTPTGQESIAAVYNVIRSGFESPQVVIAREFCKTSDHFPACCGFSDARGRSVGEYMKEIQPKFLKSRGWSSTRTRCSEDRYVDVVLFSSDAPLQSDRRGLAIPDNWRIE